MPIYRCTYQHRITGEPVTIEKTASRPCDARDQSRNDMNARGLDASLWPLTSIAIVGTT